MSKEIIKSIEINIGDTTVKVSMKQAKELYEALAELLGQPKLTYSYTPYVYPKCTGISTWQPNGTDIITVRASAGQ